MRLIMRLVMRLHELSLRDALTHLRNRRALDDQLVRAVATVARQGCGHANQQQRAS